MKYANVIVDISHEKLDKAFQYIIDADMEKDIFPGVQVEIPFGKGNRIIKGYVIEITDQPEYDISRMKRIVRKVSGSIPIESQLIAVAAWIKDNYGSTMNKALKTVIPVSHSVKQKKNDYVGLNISIDDTKELIDKYSKDKRMASRVSILSELLSEKEILKQLLIEKLGVSTSVINTLQKNDIIYIRSDTIYRNPFRNINTVQENVTLTKAQRTVADNIINEMDNRDGKRTHLIFGVTGSGKTEVYMECIEHVIKSGRQVIVLIPEIALTYQTVKRFYGRFGDKVALINSRLSGGERFDQFKLAKDGKISIMIGPRSALFTPFSNLGLIIIDEEHEGAYKSENIPRYHARETAIMRAGLTDATVILGSATPSVEAFYRSRLGEYMLHRLDERANSKSLPKVHIVDLRQELQGGNRSILSNKLFDLMSDRLSKSQQIMLFVNRRGYSSFVSCRECGKVVKCPHCDVSLTYHRTNGAERLVCHYCGYQIQKPKNCPECGSKYLGRFGIGTESVEEKVKTLFPEASVLRMDMDTTLAKGSHEKILSEFASHEADILIGTQMIVKGHDFPNVTLVGVIAADLSLYTSDYRASERTFELLTQAAGRAGRGTEDGEVVIQTYNPDEYSIVEAAKQDYEEFYRQEILYRKMMKYPPVSNMAAILIMAEDEKLCESAADDIALRIRNSHIDGMTIIGAAQASISKISDIYRYVIYIKHDDYEMLVHVKNGVECYINITEIYRKKLNVQFDFTPLNNY